MNSQNRIKTEKYGNKDGKALYKLMNNAVDGKTGKLEKKIGVRLVNLATNRTI